MVVRSVLSLDRFSTHNMADVDGPSRKDGPFMSNGWDLVQYASADWCGAFGPPGVIHARR
jgi:hypothetical protein